MRRCFLHIRNPIRTAIKATDSRRHTHIGIADSGSVAIAANDAVLPNNWNKAWVKRWGLHGVQMSKSVAAGKLRIHRYMTSEVSGGYASHMPSRRSLWSDSGCANL